MLSCIILTFRLNTSINVDILYTKRDYEVHNIATEPVGFLEGACLGSMLYKLINLSFLNYMKGVRCIFVSLSLVFCPRPWTLDTRKHFFQYFLKEMFLRYYMDSDPNIQSHTGVLSVAGGLKCIFDMGVYI